MDFNDELQKLFSNAFEKQIEGRKRHTSKYDVIYTTFKLTILRDDALDGHASVACIEYVEQHAMLAAVERWIAWQQAAVVDGSIIVWRMKPSLSWRDEPYEGFTRRLMSLRFRAHLLSRAAYEAGPEDPEDPVENTA